LLVVLLAVLMGDLLVVLMGDLLVVLMDDLLVVLMDELPWGLGWWTVGCRLKAGCQLRDVFRWRTVDRKWVRVVCRQRWCRRRRSSRGLRPIGGCC